MELNWQRRASFFSFVGRRWIVLLFSGGVGGGVFEVEVPWTQTNDVSGPREARSREEASGSAWPCWEAALSAQVPHLA